MKRLFFLILLSIVLISSHAQHEIGIFGGGSFYMGDINPKQLFNQTKPVYGLFFRYNFDSRIAVRASLLRGEITAADADGSFTPERGLAFHSYVNEVGFQIEFNFLNYITGSEKYYFTPYLFGGFNTFLFNPKTAKGGQSLRDIPTELNKTNQTISFAIPFGIGFRYSIAKNLECGVEWGFRKTFTDYLDDVSANYFFVEGDLDQNTATDPAQLYHDGRGNYFKQDEDSGDPTWYVNNVQRGDPESNDWYSFAGVFLAYKFNFGSSYKCIDYQKKAVY